MNTNDGWFLVFELNGRGDGCFGEDAKISRNVKIRLFVDNEKSAESNARDMWTMMDYNVLPAEYRNNLNNDEHLKFSNPRLTYEKTLT